jgi:hypothetical protein
MEHNSIKAEPKDVFLHLLSIIALYVSVGSFIATLFQYINLYFPDPLENYYSVQSAISSIRWNISALIVVFPVYVWSVWFLNKLFKKEPNRREVWVRRWLVYFTLFIAAIIIIGDIVALVYNLLGGEYTIRFLLKVLVVLMTSGAVFGYYYFDLKKGREDLLKFFARVGISAITIAVVAGFFVVGSPQEERVRRFDEERVNNLQYIQSEVVSYWINKSRLPSELGELRDDIRGIVIPVDPETGTSYEYNVLNAGNICS